MSTKRLERFLIYFVIISIYCQGGSLDCQKSLDWIILNAKGNKTADLFLDASGKPPSGILGGAIYWKGSKDICDQINQRFYLQPIDIPFESKFCKLSGNFAAFNNATIIQEACMPSSCNLRDDSKLIEDFFMPEMTLKNESFCFGDATEEYQDFYYYFSIVMVGLISGIVTTASLIDGYLYIHWYFHERHYHERKSHLINFQKRFNLSQDVYTSFISFRNDFMGLNSIFRTLHPFSFPMNLMELFNESKILITIKEKDFKEKSSDPDQLIKIKNPLTFLDGIRTISLAWIIYGHTLEQTSYFINNRDSFTMKMVHQFYFGFLTNTPVSVDTFFLLSGLLSSYLLTRIYRKIEGGRNKLFFWIFYAIKRTLRLFCTALVLTWIYMGLAATFSESLFHPQGAAAVANTRICRQSWFYLPINNLISSDYVCMTWFWYLSNEFQFSLLLAPVFVVLQSFRKYSSILFSLLIVTSSILSGFLISLMNKMDIGILGMKENLNYDKIYVKPYVRMGAYGIGLLMGQVLQIKPSIFKRKTLKEYFIALMVLMTCLLMMLTTLYGTFWAVRGDYRATLVEAALFNSLQHISWTVPLAVIIFLIFNGYLCYVEAILETHFLRVLSKLSFCMYLVHPLIIVYTFTSTIEAPKLTVMTSVFYFFGNFILTLALSILIYCGIENPFSQLIKKYLP